MRIDFKNAIMIMAGLTCVWAASCLKADNPPPAKPNPALKNHYCNDPNAINYNWGFPGIPDNSVCVYPVDSFIGQWALIDSIFHSDSTFNYIDTITLHIEATEDTVHAHLKILGFCNNNMPLSATADKYGNATIDSMSNENAGQFFCTPSDTVTGQFKLLTNKDSMTIQLTISGTNAGYHKGIAQKL